MDEIKYCVNCRFFKPDEKIPHEFRYAVCTRAARPTPGLSRVSPDIKPAVRYCENERADNGDCGARAIYYETPAP